MFFLCKTLEVDIGVHLYHVYPTCATLPLSKVNIEVQGAGEASSTTNIK